MSDTAASTDPIDGLLDFLDRSPTPWHAVHTAIGILEANGFDPLDLGMEPKPLMAGTRGYVRQGASLIAFQIGMEPVAETGFRIVSAHTDSPNLRIKPQPLLKGNGWVRLGVEVYGGVIVATWTDRDLGLAGRVFVRDAETEQRTVLVDIRRPVARIPNLAIHLNRQVNEEGLKINAQTQLPAVFALDDGGDTDPLKALLAAEIGCDPADLLSWDLALTELSRPTRGGARGEFVFSGRLDNLGSSHAAIAALLRALESGFDGRPVEPTAVIALFDHEEVGSTSATGASSRLLETVLQHIAEHADPSAPGGIPRALANSWHLSADMAHAVHPAYPDKHEPNHMPALGKGPVIKLNSQQRYGTDGEGAAFAIRLCEQAGVPYQWFVSRSDLACGTTVGPLVGARLGVRSIDVGNPMLSMHSAREMCGTTDHAHMIALMEKFLRGEATP